MVLHFIRIACFMVLGDTGCGSTGASPSFNCSGVGSLVWQPWKNLKLKINIKMSFIQQQCFCNHSVVNN